MAYINKEKLFSKVWFKSYSLIILGSFIMAVGFAFFADPHRIVPGGAYGIAIVLHHTLGVPTGLVGLAINIPLFVLGIYILGPRFGAKTFVGVGLTSFFMDLLSHFSYLLPHMKSRQPGAPDLPLINDTMLAAIVAAVLIGTGLGIIFKSKATTGGSDIIAMILSKRTRLPLGKMLIIVDSCIVGVGVVAFKDVTLAIYALITIFITGQVIDTVLIGQSYHKAVFIVSEKHQKIREKLLNDLNRGGTYFYGKGMYNGEDKKIIFTAVNGRELSILQESVRKIDANAFMTVFNAHEIRGKGFKPIIDSE